MTILAMIGNAIQFCVVILLLSDHPQRWSADDVFLVVVMLAVPALNLMWFLSTAEKGNDKKGFLSMYFERKRLEEQEKIDKLKSKINSQSDAPSSSIIDS